MITVKVLCGCGQKYAFDIEPFNGRMPQPVKCPVCGADGTTAANEIIARSLAAQTPPAPVLSSVNRPAAPATIYTPSNAPKTPVIKSKAALWMGVGTGGVALAAALAGLIWWNQRSANNKSADNFVPASIKASLQSKAATGLPIPPKIMAANVLPQSPVLPADLRQGLIFYYNFDTEPVGGKIPDQSGHGNNGLPVNVQWVKDGHQGGAARFGLTDSYLTVPNNDEINPRQLTLAVWIKTSYQDAVWRRIFDKGSFFDKGSGKGYTLTMGGDFNGKSDFHGRVAFDAGQTHAFSGSTKYTDGNWHHVVGTFNGSDARVFVDGQSFGSGHWVGDVPITSYNLTIGANRSNPDLPAGEKGASFNGIMDDVMVFNRALSAAEVQELFKLQGGVAAPKPAKSDPTAGTQSKPSLADRLKQVKQLFDQGLINQEAYDRKVNEITDSRLAFTEDDQGNLVFDTGVVKGGLKKDGLGEGLKPIRFIEPNVAVDINHGLLVPYRFLTPQRRYGFGSWEWPRTGQLLADGEAELHWAAATNRPFTLSSTWHWQAADTMDLTLRFTPDTDMAKFELFVGSYFRGFTTAEAYVKNAGTGDPGFIEATKDKGDYQLFPKNQDVLKVINDGRWNFPPYPLNWAIRPELAAPMGIRQEPKSGLTVLFMAPPEDCFAVSMTQQESPLGAFYLSLFGRDVKQGQTLAGHVRLIFGKNITSEQAIQKYQEYLNDFKRR